MKVKNHEKMVQRVATFLQGRTCWSIASAIENQLHILRMYVYTSLNALEARGLVERRPVVRSKHRPQRNAKYEYRWVRGESP